MIQQSYCKEYSFEKKSAKADAIKTCLRALDSVAVSRCSRHRYLVETCLYFDARLESTGNVPETVTVHFYSESIIELVIGLFLAERIIKCF